MDSRGPAGRRDRRGGRGRSLDWGEKRRILTFFLWDSLIYWINDDADEDDYTEININDSKYNDNDKNNDYHKNDNTTLTIMIIMMMMTIIIIY